jgi:hypothetical protein
MDPKPAYNLKKKSILFFINVFNNIPPRVTNLKNNKEKFKAALRKFLHTHCFYCAVEFSSMSNGDLLLMLFVTIFYIILHWKFEYLCIYDLSTSYCFLTHKSVECMCICNVRIYVQPVIQARFCCSLLFVYTAVIDNSISLTAFRYTFSQMGPSGFNELCCPYLDGSWLALG